MIVHSTTIHLFNYYVLFTLLNYQTNFIYVNISCLDFSCEKMLDDSGKIFQKLNSLVLIEKLSEICVKTLLN